jgi:DNA-directed RNA polymerase subunit B'
MEKDTFIAHGAALLLKERFDSDKTVIPVSEETGLMGYYDSYHDTRVEQVSTEHAEINDIEISYAFKLLLDEFKSLGLYPKLILENKY